MARSGILERVAMIISGYKIQSALDRYDIVNQTDWNEAANSQAEYLENQRGHNFRHNQQKQIKKATQNNG